MPILRKMNLIKVQVEDLEVTFFITLKSQIDWVDFDDRSNILILSDALGVKLTGVSLKQHNCNGIQNIDVRRTKKRKLLNAFIVTLQVDIVQQVINSVTLLLELDKRIQRGESIRDILP